MKIHLIIIFFISYSICFSQSGSLDIGFGNNGFVRTDIDSSMDNANAMVIQPDKKIILVGDSYMDDGMNTEFTIVRYNSYGSLDSSFGVFGKVIIPISKSHDIPYDVTLQEDGKILIAGLSTRVQPLSNFTLVRLLEDGQLDKSFGDNGIVIEGSCNSAMFRSICLQSDGKILAAGKGSFDKIEKFTLIRYNYDGSHDVSFGEDGISTIQIGNTMNSAFSVKLLPDGKIILAGIYGIEMQDTFIIIKYKSDGSLDSTFNKSGLVSLSISGKVSISKCPLLIQPEGKIIFSSSVLVSQGNSDFICIRLTDDGDLDSSFGDDGIVVFGDVNSKEICQSSVLQNDGKIVLASGSKIIRLKNDGTLDNTFGVNGISIPGLNINIRCMQLNDDGSIMLGGSGIFNNDIYREYDFALFRLLNDESLSVEKIKISYNSMSVTPNPIKNESLILFNSDMDDKISITLTDMSGRYITTITDEKDVEKGLNSITMDLPYLSDGLYFVNLKGKYHSQTLKVIKE